LWRIVFEWYKSGLLVKLFASSEQVIVADTDTAEHTDKYATEIQRHRADASLCLSVSVAYLSVISASAVLKDLRA